MSFQPTTQIGNKVLRTKAKRVNPKTTAMQRLITDLIDSMHHHKLVGMAAPQIGRGQAVFVTHIRKTKLRNKLSETDSLRVYINPRIIWRSKRKNVGFEGCGSVVNARLFGPVRRPNEVKVSATNQKGKPFTLHAKGLLARVIQHEYDHLQGVLFIDKTTNTKLLAERTEYVASLGVR